MNVRTAFICCARVTAYFIETGTKLAKSLVVVVEEPDFTLDELCGRLDVLGNKEDELLAAKRPVYHPLPITGEPFLAVLADILISDRASLLVITDEFLLVIGIAGPLKLCPLPRAERGQEDPELFLVVVLNANRRILQIRRLEGYAFCRAHSTAYALEAYESAYLKRYHPAEFLAGVLTHERGFYSPLAYTVEARRLGLSFLGPDINASSNKFHVEGKGSICVPLWKVKDLTQGTIHRIEREKRRNSFLSVREFCLRSGPSAAEVESLIRVGAFDAFGESRPRQVWQARQISRWPCDGEQGVLFGGDSPLALPRIDLSEPTTLDQLKAEMELLGFTVGAHPLDLYPNAPLETPIDTLCDFLGQVVTICGIVIADRVFVQSNGDPMKFITICDRTGIIETELFAAQYRWFGLETIIVGIRSFASQVKSSR